MERDDIEDDLGFSRSNGLGLSRGNKNSKDHNKDLMGQSPGMKNKEEKLEYGLTKFEVNALKIDL